MIGYRQSLFGYNSLKWDKRIEPVRYQEAKKSYVETLELVSANAINKFFALATAQSNYDIASFNYANADTLYRYAQGRYNIGTITENEMLQLELNRLTEETNRMNARIEMDNCMQELRSYLGIQEDRELRVRINSQVPDFSVNLDEALALAYENSPDIQAMKRRKLESESAVARPRANAGLKAGYLSPFRTDADCRKAAGCLSKSVRPAICKSEYRSSYFRLGKRERTSAGSPFQS